MHHTVPCFPVVDFNSAVYSSLGFALKRSHSNSETSDSPITPVKLQVANVATDESPDVMDTTGQFPIDIAFLYKIDGNK